MLKRNILQLIQKIKIQYHKLFNFGMLMHHKANGKFYVVYPDGKKSQAFSWKIANDYKDMFGGQVEFINLDK